MSRPSLKILSTKEKETKRDTNKKGQEHPHAPDPSYALTLNEKRSAIKYLIQTISKLKKSSKRLNIVIAHLSQINKYLQQ